MLIPRVREGFDAATFSARITELADFEYVAVTDTCGNAYVQPFQRTIIPRRISPTDSLKVLPHSVVMVRPRSSRRGRS